MFSNYFYIEVHPSDCISLSSGDGEGSGTLAFYPLNVTYQLARKYPKFYLVAGLAAAPCVWIRTYVDAFGILGFSVDIGI